MTKLLSHRTLRGLCLAAVLALAVGVLPSTARADGAYNAMRAYQGPYFGANNLPPGCTRDPLPSNPDNICYRMLDVSRLNPLDSPKIDILMLVPVSATTERDLRIMRQAIDMWEGGIKTLAPAMGLDWLAESVEFRIAVDTVDLTTGDVNRISPHGFVDPEIVVVASNPYSPGAGAGVSPLALAGIDGVPCLPVANPFDLEAWNDVPGFDSHHGGQSGIYSEACGGMGGNVCFTVAGAWDPDPTTMDWFGLYALTAHEFGHCLALGHVGDGAEKALNGDLWGPVAFNDIMSYSVIENRMAWGVGQVGRRQKCVSTLDVETFALRMSRFLDVNGDGAVNDADVLRTNAGRLQVQRPEDYHFASSTGALADCPQPDMALVPGAKPDWTPTPVPSIEPTLTVTNPAPGTITRDATIVVSGTVAERSLTEPPDPTSTTARYDDNPLDAKSTSPLTEIKSVSVQADESYLDTVIQLGQVWSTTVGPVVYSVIIDGKRFDSYILDAKQANPPILVWDGWEYVPGASAHWDGVTSRVSIRIPREFLRHSAIYAPYQISTTASYGATVAMVRDDVAPEAAKTIGVAAPPQLLPDRVDNPSDDDDLDGVPDASDRCPIFPGLGADGCTARKFTRVEVSVDGALAGSQDVDGHYGPGDFAIPVALGKGNKAKTIRVTWLDHGEVLASRELSVTRR